MCYKVTKKAGTKAGPNYQRCFSSVSVHELADHAVNGGLVLC